MQANLGAGSRRRATPILDHRQTPEILAARLAIDQVA